MVSACSASMGGCSSADRPCHSMTLDERGPSPQGSSALPARGQGVVIYKGPASLPAQQKAKSVFFGFIYCPPTGQPCLFHIISLTFHISLLRPVIRRPRRQPPGPWHHLAEAGHQEVGYCDTLGRPCTHAFTGVLISGMRDTWDH